MSLNIRADAGERQEYDESYSKFDTHVCQTFEYVYSIIDYIVKYILYLIYSSSDLFFFYNTQPTLLDPFP